jgi:hypothetical protein
MSVILMNRNLRGHVQGLVSLLLCVVVSGCTTPGPSSPEETPDKVISRINDESDRPSWLDESSSFKVDTGKVVSLGQTTIPGDNRVEAAYRIAENNAKSGICSAIEQRLDFVFQNAEEGTGIDATQARSIGAEACKMTTSSIRSGKRYWEKVATTTDSGSRVTQYRVFATVEMPESDFKRAVLAAVKNQQGKGGLSKDFSDKVNNHWDNFVGGKP